MSTTFQSSSRKEFNYSITPKSLSCLTTFSYRLHWVTIGSENDLRWCHAWAIEPRGKSLWLNLKNTVHLQSALIEVWVQAFHSSLLLFSYVVKDIRILISADKHALKLIGAFGPPSAAWAARAARFLLLSFHEVMFGRRINMSWSSAMKKLRRIVLGFFSSVPLWVLEAAVSECWKLPAGDLSSFFSSVMFQGVSEQCAHIKPSNDS